MSACPRWLWEAGWRVDASNQHQQMRTYRATLGYSNRAGERQQSVFATNLVYYSFTLSSAQCESRAPLRILAECVREASQNCLVIPGWSQRVGALRRPMGP